MTANLQRSNSTGVWGYPNLRSRQNDAYFFSEKNFFGETGKQVRSVLAVKVADFAQYWNGVKIPVMQTVSAYALRILGRLNP